MSHIAQSTRGIYHSILLERHLITDSHLHEFKKVLYGWRALDSIGMMEKHQSIRDFLINLYKEVLQVRLLIPFFCFPSDKPLQRHPDLHSESILVELLTLDDIALCARLAVSVTNKNEYGQILGRRGPAAQALLNLLQAVRRKLSDMPQITIAFNDSA